MARHAGKHPGHGAGSDDDLLPLKGGQIGDFLAGMDDDIFGIVGIDHVMDGNTTQDTLRE